MYYSGSKTAFDVTFTRIPTNGLWLTKCKNVAKSYATTVGTVKQFKVKCTNTLDIRNLGWQCTAENARKTFEQFNVVLPDTFYDVFLSKAKEEEQTEWFTYAIIDGEDWKTDRYTAIQAIKDAGFDSLILLDSHYLGEQLDSLVIFDEKHIEK
jgi:hypothetical protein